MVFRYVTAEGRYLTRFTLVWLLMQVLTPFATRVLTGDGGFQVRFILYAALQAIASVVFILMVVDIQRHGAVREDTPPTLMSRAKWRSAGIAIAFVISMPIAYLSEGAAFACWIVIPLLIGVFAQARRRAQPASSQSPASTP